MPFYDYACQECDHAMEVRASISQKEKGLDLRCPECGSSQMQQIFKELSFIGASASNAPAPRSAMPAAPCGGHCACHPGY